MPRPRVPRTECGEICDIENSNFIAQPDGPYWTVEPRFQIGDVREMWDLETLLCR
jgi:hypothetical protein